MKKNILTISTFFALATTVVYGQQEKLLTHFIYDKMTINPGSTGLMQGFSGTMVYRNQWDKVNGAPNSVLFNAEANIDRVAHGGVGLSFYHDAIGEMRQNNLLLNYNFPIRIPHAGTLGVGVGLGLVNIGFNPEWIPPVTINDPLLPLAKGGSNLDLNMGLFWQGDSKSGKRPYYVGLSATHLTEAEIKNVKFSNARHYFMIAGLNLMDVFGEGKSLDFQMLARTDMVKYSAELNARYLHDLSTTSKKQLYGGVTYRISDGIGFMLGANIGKATIGYSYDLTTNKLADISRGSHEFVLRYIHMLPPPPVQKAKHPRWL